MLGSREKLKGITVVYMNVNASSYLTVLRVEPVRKERTIITVFLNIFRLFYTKSSKSVILERASQRKSGQKKEVCGDVRLVI